MEARCQCGRIRFTCPQSVPTCIYICHCTECRHQSGSAFGVSAIFPPFTIEPKDEADLLREYTRKTLKGALMRCYFCAHCGVRLMHARDGVNNVSVKGGCLASLTKELMADAIHIWTSEAVVDIPQGMKQFMEEPPDD